MTSEPLKYRLLFQNTLSRGAPTDGFSPAATQRSAGGSIRTQRDKLTQPKETSEKNGRSEKKVQVKSVCAATREKKEVGKRERGPKKSRQDVIA